MSAYICDNKTISALAKAFVHYGITFKDNITSQQAFIIVNDEYKRIGQSLLDQNYRSVNYRYGEDTKTPEFEYEDVEIDEGIIYGCISCYDYQACETDDYFESAIHHSLMNLKEQLLERLIKRCGMKAPYGYNGHDMLGGY